MVATIVVPEHAPQTKIDAIERYGGRVIKVPYDEWWHTMMHRPYPGVDGLFVHPVADDRVMAGNGTIGLELLEQLDDFDAVVVPYGGGGLVTGIASAVGVRPEVQFFSAEPATGAPARPRSPPASRPHGRLHAVVRRRLGQPGADPARVGARVAAARRRVCAVARRCCVGGAADRRAGPGDCGGSRGARRGRGSSGSDGARKVVCVVSGGNIDLSVLGADPRRGDPVNVDAVRSRFTALQNGFAFFDAPGGTQVPDEVGQAIANALRDASGNLGAPYATGARRRGDPRRARRRTPAASSVRAGRDLVRDEHDDTRLRDFASRRTGLRARGRGVTTQLDHDGGVAPWVELAADKGLVVGHRGDRRPDGRLRRS